MERHQDEESACEGYLSCQPRTFCRYRLFHYLHEHLVVFCQRLCDAAVFLYVGQALCLVEWEEFLTVALHLFQVFGIALVLVSQVEIV